MRTSVDVKELHKVLKDVELDADMFDEVCAQLNINPPVNRVTRHECTVEVITPAGGFTVSESAATFEEWLISAISDYGSSSYDEHEEWVGWPRSEDIIVSNVSVMEEDDV